MFFGVNGERNNKLFLGKGLKFARVSDKSICEEEEGIVKIF